MTVAPRDPPSAPVAVAPARVFVHDVFSLDYLAAVAPLHPELNAYPERALLLAGPGDVVCVLEPVDPEALGFLASIGAARDRRGGGPGPRGSRGEQPCRARTGGAQTVALAAGPFPPGARLAVELAREVPALRRIASLVRAAPVVLLEPFVSTAREAGLAEAFSRVFGRSVRVAAADPVLVWRADRKDSARRLAAELGLPVAPGEVVPLGSRATRGPSAAARLEAALRRRAQATGRAVVKGALGAWGSATRVASGNGPAPAGMAEEICRTWECDSCVVESLLELTLSPNVAMWVEPAPGAARIVGVTDQRLDERLGHVGNAFPSAAGSLEAILTSAERLALRLQLEGYRGPVGFDFGEYRDPATGELRHFLAEVNPRVNGSLYPLALRERLSRSRREAGRIPLEAFTSGAVTTRARSFREVRQACGPLLLDRESGAGVVPYATGGLRHGKLGLVALAQTRPEAEDLHARAARALA